MQLPADIFKAYDIRGIVGRTLTEPIVHAVGQALGSLAREQDCHTIAIGRDGQLSGPAFIAALADGIRAAGANVVDLGMVVTPMTYFAAQHLGTRCSTMVTGSHNPPDYNGLKMVIAGKTLSGDDIQALRARIERSDLMKGAGSYRTHDIGPAYLQRIVGDVKLARPLRIAVDCGNGVAGAYAPELFRTWVATSPSSLRRRRPFPESPPRSVAAQEPEGPDRAAGPGRLRPGPRVRRRRRPARRRHAQRRRHLPGSPADALRSGRAGSRVPEPTIIYDVEPRGT